VLRRELRRRQTYSAQRIQDRPHSPRVVSARRRRRDGARLHTDVDRRAIRHRARFALANSAYLRHFGSLRQKWKARRNERRGEQPDENSHRYLAILVRGWKAAPAALFPV